MLSGGVISGAHAQSVYGQQENDTHCQHKDWKKDQALLSSARGYKAGELLSPLFKCLST